MHPLQSIEWEKARQEMKIETKRIDDFLLTIHKIPYTNYKIGYLPRSKMPNYKTLGKLYDFGKKNNLIFIKIEPYSPLVVLSEARNLAKRNLIKSPHPLFPSWTQILDLNKSEEDLMKKFHPKTRYNIKLAEKKGVVVKEESDDKGFEIFTKLYFQTCKRQKYFGHDYKYHKTVWDNMKNKIAHILTAYYNNVPLAAYQLWHLDDTIYYVYGGTSDQHRNLMASNLLMWETIKLGKKLKAMKLDMWGSLPPDYNSTHPWSGFTRFKSGYGTEFKEFFGSYDIVIKPFAYKIYNLIYLIREQYLRMKA